MEGDHAIATTHMQTPSPGATVEVAKKPKGRPKGSKNRPKAPLLVSRDDMAPYILEVPHGNDVVEAIYQFSRRKNLGLCVLTASGMVLNATLRLSSAVAAPEVTCSGHYLILSMSAAFAPHQSPASPSAPKPLTVSLSAPNGHVIGGLVSSRLLSVGPVFVIATSFNSPSYHMLANEDEESVRNRVAREGESGHAPPPLSGGIPMYNDSLQLPFNGLWASVTRPSQPAPSTPPQRF